MSTTGESKRPRNALQEALEQRDTELQVINIVQEGLLAGTDIDGIYRLVGDFIREIFDVQVVIISTYDHKQELERFRYLYEHGKIVHPSPRPIDRLRQQLIDTRELLLINENAADTFAQITGKSPEPVPGTAFPKSMLFAPLLLGDYVMGYVSLQNIDRENAFSDHHVDTLRRLTNSVTVALESARLFEAEKKRADEQKALLDTMTDLSRKLELNQLLDSVVERTVSLLGVTGGELAIYHEASEELEVVSSHNLGMQSAGTRLKHGEGAMGMVAETKEPLLIPDYQDWAERSNKYRQTTVRGVMVVPLMIGEQLVGALASVHLDADRKFGPQDLRLVNLFAPLAATAIENARLFEAERRRADEQQALLDTMSDLSRKLELSQLLGAVIERASALLNVTGGELAIYHPEAKELEVVASHNLGMQSLGTRLAHGEGAMGMVAETKKPLLIPDYQNWEGRSDKYQKTTVRAVMVVPLTVGDQLVGTLANVHLEEGRRFGAEDLRLLNMFAPLAATAIDNARLFEAEKQRADEQKALLDTMSDLSRKLDLGQLLGSVIERASALLDVTGGELAIYHEEEFQLEVVASHNLGMQSIGTRLSHGEGAMGKVAETKEPLIIPDYQNWEGRSNKYQKTTVRGVMVVPLMIGNQLVGTLASVHLEEGRTFGAEDLRLLDMFAPLAATAIENARLCETTHQLLEEAEQRARELKETQQQLVMQEKLASLGQLTAGIAHEIKNPLNFVINFSDLSNELIEEAVAEMDKLDGHSPESREACEELSAILNDIGNNLEKIHEHGSRADRIVKSMLQHSRGGNGVKEPVDLDALLREYTNLAYHGMRAGPKPINVDIDLDFEHASGEVSLIREDFSRVILNLINNAFDAMWSKKQEDRGDAYLPRLSVRTRKGNGRLVIEIADNGPGIPEEIGDKILQPFFTTKKGTEGTGLGLSITHDIIEAHGGTLDFQSSDDGTLFTITLNGNS